MEMANLTKKQLVLQEHEEFDQKVQIDVKRMM